MTISLFTPTSCICGLPVSTYAPRGRGGVKSPINFRYVLQAKGGEEVQKTCKIVYVLNRRPLCIFFLPYIIMYVSNTLYAGTVNKQHCGCCKNTTLSIVSCFRTLLIHLYFEEILYYDN